MLVAVLSDIHGNRHALEAVLEHARAEGADELWCLGDVVGYGPTPRPASRWPASTPTSAWPATTTSP
jgi:predicted phosphodiesterase